MGSARVKGKSECIKCGFCCIKRTCAPTPDELFIIAAFLEMSVEELINKYFAIDRRNFEDTYYLVPVGVNIQDLAGKFKPHDRTYNEGRCIFLEGYLCRIYPVRPREAAESMCWSEEETFHGYDTWKGNALLHRFGIDGEALAKEVEW